MPRKCCTIFDGKSCRTNYDATKEHPFEGGTVYGFPSDLNEQERWERKLPNKLHAKLKNADGTIKKTVGVCFKHFRDDCPTKVQRGGSHVPTEAPTIFGNTEPSLFTQTTPNVSRNPEKRNVTADARASTSTSDDPDIVKNFTELVEYCKKFTPVRLLDVSEPSVIKIFKLNDKFPPDVVYSLLIRENFHVEAYRGHMKVKTRDLINKFSSTLTRFSQIDDIIDRLETTPVDVRCELRSCGDQVLILADEFDEDDADKRQKVIFTGKQLLAFDSNRYSHEDMLEAINLYLRSRNSYRALRAIIILPCPNTVQHYFGKYGLTGGAIECEKTIKNVFSALNEGQKDCFLSFDEIHIKPGLQFQGQHVLGNAQNTTEPTPANAMLGTMVNPSYGAPAFIARLVPVKNLKHEFLYGIVLSVVELIHVNGGRVFLLMSDNLSVNKKTFKTFHEVFGSRGITSITHPFPNSKFENLFTLYDPTHLFKNIRNNWCTEKSQTLEFTNPDTNEKCTAKWSDLVKMYKEEIESGVLRETKLDYTTLNPNNFEKQKVHLVVNIFNEKTVAKLEGRSGMEGTHIFVKLVTRMWNILNIRSCDTARRLNDPDREKFTDPNDPRLNFLLKMATMFKKMDCSLRGQRSRGLTSETADALHRTLHGIVEIIRTLLRNGQAYVLPGKFTSDRIEGEFGICRQGSGGNYLIGAAQVINSIKLQRLKLYAKLDIQNNEDDVKDDCCLYELHDSEGDLELIESCFAESSSLSVTEKSTLYYICGYVTFKQNIVCLDENDTVPLPEASEFTTKVSRGKLKLPPLDLYDLSQYYYSFFKARTAKCCTKIYLQAFREIYKYTGYSFENIEQINRRMCNCFFKAFVKDATDTLKRETKDKHDKREVKKTRLSAKC